MRVRDNAGDLRDLYRGPRDKPAHVLSVCHMSDSDTLLFRLGGWNGRLVALSRYGRVARGAAGEDLRKRKARHDQLRTE